MTKKAKPNTPIDRSFFDDHTEYFPPDDPRWTSLKEINKQATSFYQRMTEEERKSCISLREREKQLQQETEAKESGEDL